MKPHLPITVPEHFRIIAHRGASAYAPENTLPAFELAKRMGAREVEVDTQLAADGVVVLCHDDSLQRYGHGDQAVEELPSGALLPLDMGSWFSPFLFANTPMVTLDQLAAQFADDFVFHTELKGMSADLPAKVFSIAEQHGLIERSIVTSFSWEQLERMRSISSNYRLGWLVHDFDQEVVDRAARLNLFQLCPPARTVTEQLVKLGHGVVKEIRVWGMSGPTSEIPALIQKVVDSGCDGMTIDWPDWATHPGDG